MKAFVSWSGGKDCMLATYRYLNEADNKIGCLLNMCSDNGDHSRSHGIKKHLISNQAESMNIPLIQKATGIDNYEKNFKKVIGELKMDNFNAGVFGDIYLEEHRTWIERVCNDMGIIPIFPLWGANTGDLLDEFIDNGFKTIVVAIDNRKLSTDWLGRIIDEKFHHDIKNLPGIDPCAENGEYHSFVYDGPIFNGPVRFTTGEKYTENNNSFIKLN